MKLNLLKKEKNYMEFEIEDATESMLIPLRNQLLLDDSVDSTNYNINHPRLDNPRFFLSVRSGKPQNALKKATKALSNQYRDMLSEINNLG